MEVYHAPFEDGEFLAALHHKLSVMHEDVDESSYPPVKTSEIDFHSKFGDFSLELDSTTPPRSPSTITIEDEDAHKSSSSGSSVFRAPKTTSHVNSNNSFSTSFPEARDTQHLIPHSSSKPLFDESPSASTKLLEEYKRTSSQPLFPSWPGTLPDFTEQEDSPLSNKPSILDDNNNNNDKSTSILKTPLYASSALTSPVISLASLDDMLNKYKRRYDTHLQALRQRVTSGGATKDTLSPPSLSSAENDPRADTDLFINDALSTHSSESAPLSPFRDFITSMKKIESAYNSQAETSHTLSHAPQQPQPEPPAQTAQSQLLQQLAPSQQQQLESQQSQQPQSQSESQSLHSQAHHPQQPALQPTTLKLEQVPHQDQSHIRQPPFKLALQHASPTQPEPLEMFPQTPTGSDYYADRDSEYSSTPATPSDVLDTSSTNTPTSLSASQRKAAHEKDYEQIMLLNPYQQGVPALRNTAYRNSSLSLRAYLQSSHDDSVLTSESECTSYDKSQSDEPPSPFTSHLNSQQPTSPPFHPAIPTRPTSSTYPTISWQATNHADSQSDELPSPFALHLSSQQDPKPSPSTSLHHATPTHPTPHFTIQKPETLPSNTSVPALNPTTHPNANSHPSQSRHSPSTNLQSIYATDSHPTNESSDTPDETSHSEDEDDEEGGAKDGKATSFWVPFSGEKFTAEQFRKYQLMKARLEKKETQLKHKAVKSRKSSKNQKKETKREQKKLEQRQQQEEQKKHQEEMMRQEQERKEASRQEQVRLREKQYLQHQLLKHEQQKQKKIQQQQREERRQQLLQQHLDPQSHIHHHQHYNAPSTNSHSRVPHSHTPQQPGIRNPSPSLANTSLSKPASLPKKTSSTPTKSKATPIKPKTTTPAKSRTTPKRPSSASSSKSTKSAPIPSQHHHSAPSKTSAWFHLSQEDQSIAEPSYTQPLNPHGNFPTIDYATIPPAPAPFDTYFSSLDTQLPSTSFTPQYFKLPLYSQSHPLPVAPPPQSQFNNLDNIANQHYEQPTFPPNFPYNNENIPPYSHSHSPETSYGHPRPPLYPRSKQPHFPPHSQHSLAPPQPPHEIESQQYPSHPAYQHVESRRSSTPPQPLYVPSPALPQSSYQNSRAPTPPQTYNNPYSSSAPPQPLHQYSQVPTPPYQQFDHHSPPYYNSGETRHLPASSQPMYQYPQPPHHSEHSRHSPIPPQSRQPSRKSTRASSPYPAHPHQISSVPINYEPPYDQFTSRASYPGQGLNDRVTPVRFARSDTYHREDPFDTLFKSTEELSSPDVATLEWADFLNRGYGGLPSARKDPRSTSKENNRRSYILKLLTYARIPPDHVVSSQEEKTMLRDLIQDHPEFEACFNLLKSENAFSHVTGLSYNCTKALKIYNPRQHRLVQALENYNNKDGENVKLVFYWSNDHQHLADVALRGFGGVAEKGESEYSSADTSDLATLQEWLVFGDAISMAKKGSEIFEYQPPMPTKQTWRALAVMVKTGKVYKHPTIAKHSIPAESGDFLEKIREIASSSEYLELIREGFDTVEFEDELSGLRMYICFSAFRCIPIYLLQFDQYM